MYKALPKDLPRDEIWAYFFRNNTSTNFCFVLSIPTSNAFCKRVFSQLNSLWTKERNRMSMDLIKSELQTRINVDESCSEMLSLLQSSDGEKLIKLAKPSDKYFKKWSIRNFIFMFFIFVKTYCIRYQNIINKCMFLKTNVLFKVHILRKWEIHIFVWVQNA